MVNKATMLWSAMACCLLMLAACKTPNALGTLRSAVQKCDSIAMYSLPQYPTPQAEQKLGEVYLNGYPLSKRVPLTPAEMEAIKAALLLEQTFDSSAVKSCPALPEMLLTVHSKGKVISSIALCPAPCGKALIYSDAKKPEPLYMELTPGNTLEPLVFREGNSEK